MIIWKFCKCESCSKGRQFKYNTTLNKLYNYKPKCKQCMLTERNKLQNFSPRKHPIVDYFEIIDTQEKAYIFGFLWADGCMVNASRKNKANIKRLTMILNPKDKEILDFIITNFGGSYTLGTYFDKRTDKTYDRAHWNLNSKDVYDNFIKLNFRIDSSAIPDHLFNHFLRGIIDGDGNIRIRKNKHIEIKITSSLNQNWNYISDRIKFPFTIYKHEYKFKKYSDFYIRGNKQNFLSYLYDNANFFLKRKYKIIEHIL